MIRDLSLYNALKKQRLLPVEQSVFQMPNGSKSALKAHGNTPSAENQGKSITPGILGGLGDVAAALKKEMSEETPIDPDFPPLWQEGTAGAPKPGMFDGFNFKNTMMGRWLF